MMGVDLATQWYMCLLFGVTAGFASALLGIGGGVVLMPLLLLVASGFGADEARGTALGFMVGTCLVGAVVWGRTQGVHLDLSVILLLTVGGAVGAYFGVKVGSMISLIWLKRVFALLMVFAAVRMFWGTMGSSAAAGEKAEPPEVLSGPAQ
ncbi:MAG TPA: TSUP family transporter [Planctomycetota bacterium]|nr:TSUP family transporter [Planctomycetota bacterium]